MLRNRAPIRSLLYPRSRGNVTSVAPEDEDIEDVETPFGTVYDANVKKDAVFTYISSVEKQNFTRFLGLRAAQHHLPETLIPMLFHGDGQDYDPAGFENLRFVGWLIDRTLITDGVVGAPLALWLSYNRLQKDLSLALDRDTTKEIQTVVIKTFDCGGTYQVRWEDTRALWGRIERAVNH